jgi:hypothetical protein
MLAGWNFPPREALCARDPAIQAIQLIKRKQVSARQIPHYVGLAEWRRLLLFAQLPMGLIKSG